MAGQRTSALLARTRSELADLGSAPGEGHFVCPLCLRLLRDERATEGHYPAAAMPGRHQTELLCVDCNSFVGAAYEGDAVKFFKPEWDAKFGPPSGSRIRRKATIETTSDAISIQLHGRRDVKPALDAALARSRRPRELEIELSRPTGESVKRALVAWSYLAWFYYAGYRFANSAGGELVRRLILEPERPLPTTIVYVRGELELPLESPDVVLLLLPKRVPVASIDDIEEFIGLGTQWGPAMVVFPFSNDPSGAPWTRLALLGETGLTRIGNLPLRKMLSIPIIEKGLRSSMVLEQAGVRQAITEDLSPEEVASLAKGESGRRIESHVGSRVPKPPRRVERATVVEALSAPRGGRQPPPS